jgi:hypothetical protein
MVLAVPHFSSRLPGNIKEISRSGLIFQYHGNGNIGTSRQKMDIIWADYVATHHLEQIPVRIVSDVILDKERENNESIIRRQAVAFENLTPHQENQLRRLIQARGTIPL